MLTGAVLLGQPLARPLSSGLFPPAVGARAVVTQRPVAILRRLATPRGTVATLCHCGMLSWLVARLARQLESSRPGCYLPGRQGACHEVVVPAGSATRACLVGDRRPCCRAPLPGLSLSQGETCRSPPGHRWCSLTFRRGSRRGGLPGPAPAFNRRGGRSRGLRTGRRRDPRCRGALHLVAAGLGSGGYHSQVARRQLSTGASRAGAGRAGSDARLVVVSPSRVPAPGTIVTVDAGDSGDLGVLDRAEARLEDVERALRRLDEGTYAICEACGRAIGDDRLARSPVTRRCADHGPPLRPGASAGI